MFGPELESRQRNTMRVMDAARVRITQTANNAQSALTPSSLLLKNIAATAAKPTTMVASAWTVLAAALVVRQHRYIAAAGVLISLGVVAGMAEPFGVPMAGAINAISYTLWAVWTLVLGIVVLRGERREALPAPRAA